MEKETLHKKFMNRCISLAQSGMGNVAPNPLVGCVIVHKDQIIGEGYHIKYGEAHAEVNAINSVKDKSLLEKATLYVNLEPCSHYGKTPPCSNLIIEKKIPNVVIGSIDTFSEVSGKGIAALKEAGCEVLVGILENDCRELNRRFFTFYEHNRPYVILKWAQTTDGFIDVKRISGDAHKPVWITNDTCKMLVHKWRSEEDAFMVGTNTVIQDNPQLTTREWSGKNPVRVVLDRTLRISTGAAIYDQSAKTVIFNELVTKTDKNIEYIKIDFSANVIESVLKVLFTQNIQSVVVEGGAQLLQSFIDLGLWDEARIFYGSKFFYEGIAAPKIKGTIIHDTTYDESRLVIFRK